MRIHVTKPLFPWDCLEDSPSLKTLRELLRAIPDGRLLDGLRQWRGKGRTDYSVSALWGVVVLTIALRHTSIANCLAELERNEGLRQVIGIESEAQVPKAWNMSRFLKVLGQEPHRSEMLRAYNVMAQRLGLAIEDLGKNLAGDSTTLNARRSEAVKAQVEAAKAEAAKTEAAKAEAAKAEAQKKEQAVVTAGTEPTEGKASSKSPEKPVVIQEDGLPIPMGGKKEYRDDAGKVTKVLEWHGYKAHLLVDVKHEVVLAYEVTAANVSDNEMIEPLVKQAKANLPKDRIKTLAYDKAADDSMVHELLKDEEIKPVIQIRSLWRNQTEQLVPGQEHRGNIVHDEAGTVYCVNTVSQPPIKHQMSYIGNEPDRGTIKYRCPAMHEGWTCPMSATCNAGKLYGLTVRVKQETDLRRFPLIPRATKKFETLYNGRTAVERVNARLKIFWGADDGNITGAGRFHAYFSAVMLVHGAFATVLAKAPRFGGVLGQTRISTVAKALEEQIQT